MSERSEDIKRRRKKAIEEFDQRTLKLVEQVNQKGRPKLRIRPLVNRANSEKLAHLIGLIEGRLETVGTNEFGLYNILTHLKQYNLENPPTDEAGFDTPGFELAISELNEVFRFLDHGQEEKAFEYLLYRYKVKKFANKLDMAEFIPVLHLEAATNCNLRCTMCYQCHNRLQTLIEKQKPVHMPWDLFTKVVDEAYAQGCRAVVFAGRGEPTLNRLFGDMLEYCHKKGVLHLKFNTNVTMRAEAWEQFTRRILSMDACLTVVFSVDAGDKQVFEEIRVGADFDKVKANVETFARIRREEFPDSPVRTRINMVLSDPRQDPEAARVMWSPLVDEFSARLANSEQGGGTYLDTNPDGSLRDVAPGRVCLAPWTRVYVWADGTVNPCENDYLSKLQLGNANKELLHKIWTGDTEHKLTLRKLRLAFITGKKNTIYPCRNCLAK